MPAMSAPGKAAMPEMSFSWCVTPPPRCTLLCFHVAPPFLDSPGRGSRGLGRSVCVFSAASFACCRFRSGFAGFASVPGSVDQWISGGRRSHGGAEARRKQREEPTTGYKGNWRVPCSCLCVETPVVAHMRFALPRQSTLCGCIIKHRCPWQTS
jgi:hypothetical protein